MNGPDTVSSRAPRRLTLRLLFALLLLAAVGFGPWLFRSPSPPEPVAPVSAITAVTNTAQPRKENPVPEDPIAATVSEKYRLDNPLATSEFVIVEEVGIHTSMELDPWGQPYYFDNLNLNKWRILRTVSDNDWDRLLDGREEHVMARSPDDSHEVKWTKTGVYLIGPTGQERIAYSPHEANWALFSNDGRWVALRNGRRFTVWNVAKRSMHLWGRGERFCFSPNSRYFLFGETPETTTVHDLEADLKLTELLGTLPEQALDFSKPTIFSKNGVRILTVQPGKARVYEFPGGKMLCELWLPPGSVHCFDGGYLTAEGDRAVLFAKEQMSVWDVRTGKLLSIDAPSRNPQPR